MKSLASLVQGLPAELYQEIYDLTFTTGAGEHSIKQNYKPPNCLQVNRSTRESFARSYYGEDSTFLVDGPADRICAKWINRLPDAHAAMLSEIRVVKPRMCTSSLNSPRLPVHLDEIGEDLFWEVKGKIDYRNVVKFKVTCEVNDKTCWLSYHDACLP